MLVYLRTHCTIQHVPVCRSQTLLGLWGDAVRSVVAVVTMSQTSSSVAGKLPDSSILLSSLSLFSLVWNCSTPSHLKHGVARLNIYTIHVLLQEYEEIEGISIHEDF